MAYRITLHSVSEGQIDDLRLGRCPSLKPSATFAVSHQIASGVELEPARSLLQEALEGGQDLGQSSSATVCQARYHDRGETRRLETALQSAWSSLQIDAAYQLHRWRDWWEDEIGVVLRALDHAASRDECLVSILTLQVDRDSSDVRRLFAAG